MREIKCHLIGLNNKQFRKTRTDIFTMFTQGSLEVYDPTKNNYSKLIYVHGQPILIEILDIVGQEEYSAMRDQYIRTGQVFIIMFHVESRNSFEEVSSIHERILRAKDDEYVPTVLVGVKNTDDSDKRQVSQSEGLDLALTIKALYVECSVLMNINIETIFHKAAELILENESDFGVLIRRGLTREQLIQKSLLANETRENSNGLFSAISKEHLTKVEELVSQSLLRNKR